MTRISEMAGTKAEVLRLLAHGLQPSEVAMRVGVTREYVRKTRYNYRSQLSSWAAERAPASEAIRHDVANLATAPRACSDNAQASASAPEPESPPRATGGAPESVRPSESLPGPSRGIPDLTPEVCECGAPIAGTRPDTRRAYYDWHVGSGHKR